MLPCSNVEEERRAIEWIKWLLTEDQFERSAKASFGEMLLLIAIHFHSNQNNAIADLVSSTLGMKSTVKGNTLGRMKTIFTQDIFTEQVTMLILVRRSKTVRAGNEDEIQCRVIGGK